VAGALPAEGFTGGTPMVSVTVASARTGCVDYGVPDAMEQSGRR
jgi:hypothetical protein